MISSPALSDLIGLIYDCVLQPAHWSDALALLCRELDAKAASISVLNPIAGTASIYVDYGTDPAWTALLMAQYAGMSPLGSAVLTAEIDQPVSAFDFIDEAEFTSSRFYREWAAPQGYHDMMGALISKKATEIGAVSATRHVDKPRFDQASRQTLALVTPHFRRAVTIAGLLEHRAVTGANFRAVVESLRAAVVLIDGDRRVVFANPCAQALLAEGSALLIRNGRVVVADAEADRKLRSSMAACDTVPLMLPLDVVGGGRRTLAVVRTDAASDVVALLLHEPQSDIPAIGSHLVRTFGFTPREVAVLMPLLEGRTAEDISELLGVGVATVRSHLGRLFEKTGTSRQHDLVRVVLAALPPTTLP